MAKKLTTETPALPPEPVAPARIPNTSENAENALWPGGPGPMRGATDSGDFKPAPEPFVPLGFVRAEGDFKNALPRTVADAARADGVFVSRTGPPPAGAVIEVSPTAVSPTPGGFPPDLQDLTWIALCRIVSRDGTGRVWRMKDERPEAAMFRLGIGDHAFRHIPLSMWEDCAFATGATPAMPPDDEWSAAAHVALRALG